MKKALIFFFVLNFLSCKSEKNDDEADGSDFKKVELNKSENIKQITIKGFWGDKNGEYPLFEIRKDSLCYLEGDGCFELKIENQNITIFYDGFIEKYNYQLDSLSEKLILTNKVQKNIYYRFKDN